MTHCMKFEYLYLRKLSMICNKVVWDKHYYSNRFTVRNIFYYVTVDFALYVSLSIEILHYLRLKICIVNTKILFICTYLGYASFRHFTCCCNHYKWQSLFIAKYGMSTQDVVDFHFVATQIFTQCFDLLYKLLLNRNVKMIYIYLSIAMWFLS